jgi:pyruvate-formate lyase-activating enzyme
MTPQTQTFQAFIPLSNWILGFDRYRQVFDKSLVPGNTHPDGFYVVDPTDESSVALVLAKTRALVARLKVPGDRMLCLEAQLPTGPDGALPNTFTGTGVGWRYPHTALPLSRVGFVEGSKIEFTNHEMVTAEAFALNTSSLIAWKDCAPRTFSVLSVAKACNASCAFCFSKASLSSVVKPEALDFHRIGMWADRAHFRGARRAVITGGGEPTVIPFEQMTSLIAQLSSRFSSVLLITNGYRIEQWANSLGDIATIERLKHWKQTGLTRVAISRHGADIQGDAKLMGLAVDTPRISRLLHQAGLAVRYIGVMQRGGIDSFANLEAYLRRAAQDGVSQVCLKELYVSSLSENQWGASAENLYCQANQVPLSMAIQSLVSLGFKVSHTLPWGSPVYAGMIDGVLMEVAAYTEPSVGWERTHGQVRSWNLLSSGACMASLEDPASQMFLAQHEFSVAPVCQELERSIADRSLLTTA